MKFASFFYRVTDFFALICKPDILQIYFKCTKKIHLMFNIKLYDCFHMDPKVIILQVCAYFTHIQEKKEMANHYQIDVFPLVQM